MSKYSSTRLALQLLQTLQPARPCWPPRPRWIDPLHSKPHAATAPNGSNSHNFHMNTTQIERAIQAKGLTAPRVKPEDLDANIVDTEIVKHVSKSGQILRWAVLTTRNGYAVAGKPSCSVSSANDNAEIGESAAIANAKNELWPLMGYELRSKLASSAPSERIEA